MGWVDEMGHDGRSGIPDRMDQFSVRQNVESLSLKLSCYLSVTVSKTSSPLDLAMSAASGLSP